MLAGSTATVFVNGTAIKGGPFSGNLSIDESELVIGRGDPDYSSGEYFHGAVDEIRIWKVARSQPEIQATMSDFISGKEPGLVAYWNFDDGTAQDLSGHGNGGVLKGRNPAR